ncbi:mannosyltransferase [uncultured Maribacter sp.]|uniref:mannosyltransferase n=1 Tax=uncultured Maribacter sp. TaxID=431308 RepID=UPI0026196396|nr:mannosyltransferase [uncultured Maribacter sp.]
MWRQLTSHWKLHKYSILLVLASIALYASFAYNLQREDFIKLLTLCIALFFLCYKIIQFQKWNFKFLLGVGVLFRLVFLFAEPNLSQDFYRFIWDGELLNNFKNPYLYLPKVLIEQKDLPIANAQELYNGMGELSPKFYSNYPPLNQLIFALASLLGGKTILGSITIMRISIILADIGIVYFGRKLLKNLNRSPHLIFWYFLNPLVLIELTGNLHFEGVMLFFFIWSLYLLSIDKWKTSAVVYALSILTKLVPLLFLPLFLTHFKFKKSVPFYAIVGITTTILLAPFYSSEFIANYSETVGLWFSNFEFNGSIYNIIKHTAISFFDAKPWELIKAYGKITPIITISIVLLFTFLRDNKNLNTLISSMLFILTIYYFISTTVHPWYIIFLTLLTLFTNYKYAVVWSSAVILSYWAYGQPDFKENLWFLFIEYSSVFAIILYELITQRNKKRLFCKN